MRYLFALLILMSPLATLAQSVEAWKLVRSDAGDDYVINQFGNFDVRLIYDESESSWSFAFRHPETLNPSFTVPFDPQNPAHIERVNPEAIAEFSYMELVFADGREETVIREFFCDRRCLIHTDTATWIRFPIAAGWVSKFTEAEFGRIHYTKAKALYSDAGGTINFQFPLNDESDVTAIRELMAQTQTTQQPVPLATSTQGDLRTLPAAPIVVCAEPGFARPLQDQIDQGLSSLDIVAKLAAPVGCSVLQLTMPTPAQVRQEQDGAVMVSAGVLTGWVAQSALSP